MFDKIDRDIAVRLVFLLALLIVAGIGIKSSVKAYNDASSEDVASYLSEFGFTDIQVGEKQGTWPFSKWCTRSDVAMFDFTATDSKGVLQEDMYVCVGFVRSMSDPQMTIRSR